MFIRIGEGFKNFKNDIYASKRRKLYFLSKTEFKSRVAIYKRCYGTPFWPKVETYFYDDRS